MTDQLSAARTIYPYWRAKFIHLTLLGLTLGIVLWAIPAPADWPHWRGPDRNDLSKESSSFDEGIWPPKTLLWETNVGLGSSSVICAEGQLYANGWNDQRETISCRDAATGQLLWQQSYPCPAYGRHSEGDKGIYGGCSASPEFDIETGLLYTLSIDGDLNCWNARKKGEKVWGFNLYDKYEVGMRPNVGSSPRMHRDYGYTSSPLVYKEWLLVEVGDDEGNLMAFSKTTGERIWVSDNKDPAGHTGAPVLMTVESVPCVAVLTVRNLVVTRLDGKNAGETVGVFPWTTDFANNIPTPTVEGNEVLVTSAYNQYAMAKVRFTLRGAEQVWRTDEQTCSGVCSPIIHKGHIYWAWRGVHCLDWKTGKQLWSGGSVGETGSCILTSDNRLIVWGDQGDLFLVETAQRSGGKYQELSRVRRLFSTDVWPHVVLSDGRLYCKDRRGNLKCLALKPDLKPVPMVTTTDPTPKPVPLPPIEENAEPITTWPGERGLVVGWKRNGKLDQLQGSVAKQPEGSKLTFRDKAKLDQNGWLNLDGGAALISNAESPLLKACQNTGELSIEVVIQTLQANQEGPARIVSFSRDGYARNFTLAQDGNSLLLRLRTPATGENGMNPQTTLCTLPINRPVHVIVTYKDGHLVCYVDGKPVRQSSEVREGFKNWEAFHLLLGDEYDGGGTRNWSGTMERFAIFNRFIGPKEAQQRWLLVKKDLPEP